MGQFIQHIAKLRGLIREGRIEGVDALQEGQKIAERHIVRATKTDGTPVETEVYLFGALAADGGLERVQIRHP